MPDPFEMLADKPVWVCWREEPRGGKPTKVPYCARGGLASATDPGTWATRQEAEKRVPTLLNGSGQKGGVGVTLGAIPLNTKSKGSYAHLVGVDLDSCLDERGVPATWAAAIVKALATYTEVSPSGRGLKAFFCIRTGAVRPFLDLLGVDKGSWGCKRGIPGLSGADHGPGIELYAAGRYFTVTGQVWPAGRPHMVLLDWDELQAVAKLLPKPSRITRPTASSRITRPTRSAGRRDAPEDNAERDTSRSGKAWRAAYAFRNTSYEEMRDGLRDHDDADIREWVEEKGLAHGERELRRLWERGIADAAEGDAAGTAAEDDEQPHRRYPLMSFDDVTLNTTRPYLVQDLIPREGLVVVWGPPKCGKTFWVFDLVLHVALGWPYRGRRVEKSTVVYIACEGERGLRARKVAFAQTHLAHRGFADQVRSPPFYLLSTQLDLVKEVNRLGRDIDAQIPDGPVGAIVIDTLNRSLAGSENKDEDMTAYIDAASALATQFHCAVIIIHHCGINETRPRGHTSLTGAVEAQLAVQRDEAERIVTKVEYMKDGPEDEQVVSRLQVVELGLDEDGELLTSCVVEEVRDEEAATAGRRQKPLPKAQRRALEHLHRAIQDKGFEPPETEGVPTNTLCVLLDTWRKYAIEGGISTSDIPDSHRRIFIRASEDLIESERVGMHGELVWVNP